VHWAVLPQLVVILQTVLSNGIATVSPDNNIVTGRLSPASGNGDVNTMQYFVLGSKAVGPVTVICKFVPTTAIAVETSFVKQFLHTLILILL